ncbi:MAG: 4-hydroxy-3-methylbut-2-enyl diphosphate reductase [Erysipelotrichaceae bacterium]|nr:4-hydroxy-3-methylbut-2-enyl diphosphate reductase [Erysipelotrichaceae bacterium]
MKIKKVIPSGYCKGVVNAIKLALKTRKENPDVPVYILGMLVHNDYVSRQLEAEGIITLYDEQKTKEELLDEIDEGVIIFTAHGISDAIKQKVTAKGLRYVDATCVDVLKTQQLIKERLKDAYEVLYFGKKGHPEAEAVLSISNQIHLISSMKDIDALSAAGDKLFFTNQTTMSYLELKEIIGYLKERYPQIIIQPEVCNATSSRQEAIYALEDCDLLYVVGDKRSNNTNMLKEIGLKHGIKKVFLIQTYQDIDKNDLKDSENIYVTAGASTPPELIDEVISYLRTQAGEQFAD